MFFRHYRAHYYNRQTHELVPFQKGGVSFLIESIAENTYAYWIYICPPDIPFSSKQALSTLKRVHANGIKPWDTITSDGSKPIIDLLIKSLINETNDYPSEVARHALQYLITNTSEARKKLKAESNSAKSHYETH